MPRSCFLWDDDPNRPGFHEVARVIREHSDTPPQESIDIIEHSKTIETPPVWPDKHLSCIDTTFGMVEQIGRYDMGAEARLGLGVWSQVLSKMRFSKGVEALGEKYLKETLGGSFPVSGASACKGVHGEV